MAETFSHGIHWTLIYIGHIWAAICNSALPLELLWFEWGSLRLTLTSGKLTQSLTGLPEALKFPKIYVWVINLSACWSSEVITAGFFHNFKILRFEYINSKYALSNILKELHVLCVLWWTVELGEHFVLDKYILTPLEFDGMIPAVLS